MKTQKNSDIHLRPRFKMNFNESQQNLISKFEENLKDGACKYCSKIVDGHIVIDVPIEEICIQPINQKGVWDENYH